MAAYNIECKGGWEECKMGFNGKKNKGNLYRKQ